MANAIKYDASGLKAAIERMIPLTSKSVAELINHNVIKVALGSGGGPGLVQLTRKATKEQIHLDMTTMVTAPDERGRVSTAPRIVMMATKWLKQRGELPVRGGPGMRRTKGLAGAWRAKVKAACAAIMRARIKSIAYIAAGWLWAARDLAAKSKGHKFTRLGLRNMPSKEGWTGGSASQSWAREATPNNLLCTLYNTSRGAEVVVGSATYQGAIESATHDVLVGIKKKLEDSWKRDMRRAVNSH